jgi:hypothetical protein
MEKDRNRVPETIALLHELTSVGRISVWIRKSCMIAELLLNNVKDKAAGMAVYQSAEARMRKLCSFNSPVSVEAEILLAAVLVSKSSAILSTGYAPPEEAGLLFAQAIALWAKAGLFVDLAESTIRFVSLMRERTVPTEQCIQVIMNFQQEFNTNQRPQSIQPLALRPLLEYLTVLEGELRIELLLSNQEREMERKRRETVVDAYLRAMEPPSEQEFRVKKVLDSNVKFFEGNSASNSILKFSLLQKQFAVLRNQMRFDTNVQQDQEALYRLRSDLSKIIIVSLAEADYYSVQQACSIALKSVVNHIVPGDFFP